MPFIHVKSMPFEGEFDAETMVKQISDDFARKTGVGVEHVTVTWEYFAPGHYAAGGRTAHQQPTEGHPILVDLLAPDFNTPSTIETMMTAVASSIAARASMPISNIFINQRQAHSGMVFDSGKVERW